jgi:hypothetical protein
LSWFEDAYGRVLVAHGQADAGGGGGAVWDVQPAAGAFGMEGVDGERAFEGNLGAEQQGRRLSVAAEP